MASRTVDLDDPSATAELAPLIESVVGTEDQVLFLRDGHPVAVLVDYALVAPLRDNVAELGGMLKALSRNP